MRTSVRVGQDDIVAGFAGNHAKRELGELVEPDAGIEQR